MPAPILWIFTVVKTQNFPFHSPLQVEPVKEGYGIVKCEECNEHIAILNHADSQAYKSYLQGNDAVCWDDDEEEYLGLSCNPNPVIKNVADKAKEHTCKKG